ncbi:hypothetical protein ABZT06_44845 [Streptomyces sp. NPDC005483]
MNDVQQTNGAAEVWIDAVEKFTATMPGELKRRGRCPLVAAADVARPGTA